MADKTKIKKEAAKENQPIVVNQVILRSVDRTKKDVEDWRNAHRHAEQIEHPQTIRLFDLYSDIELDGHLTGITQKRIDSVLNKKLRYVDKAGKKIDEMDAVINSSVFREIITMIIKRKFWGRVGMEFVPGEKLLITQNNHFAWQKCQSRMTLGHFSRLE